MQSASGQEALLQRRVVCLHATGEFYKGFSILLAEHLRGELGEEWAVSATAQPREGDGLLGAMDIIDAIASLSTDDETFYIGLTQGDVAYYFQSGGHPMYSTPHVHRARVVSLARALPEYLHIVSASQNQALVPDAYGAHAQDWERLYIGPLGSGTLIASINLLPILGERPSNVLGENPDRVARQSFLSGPEKQGSAVDAWGGTLVSGAPTRDVEAQLETGHAVLVSPTNAQLRHIENVFSEIYRSSSYRYRLPSSGEAELPAVEIPAILVSSRRLPADVARAVRGFFDRCDSVASTASAELFLNGISKKAKGEAAEVVTGEFVTKLSRAITKYSVERYDNTILPQHRSVVSLPGHLIHWEVLMCALLAGACTWIGLRIRRRLPNARFFELPRSLTIPMALCACLLWFHVVLAGVTWLEYRHYMSYGTDRATPFIVQSYFELLPRLMHYVASAFSGEQLFPEYRAAQVLWMSIPFVIGAGAFLGVVQVAVPPFVRYLRDHLGESREMQLSQHIVVCNWHEHAEDVICQLREQARLEHRHEESVLILSDAPESISLPRIGEERNDIVGEHILFGVALRDETGSVRSREPALVPVYGLKESPCDYRGLQRARVKDARIVVVFPDEALDDPDSPTAITLLNIQRAVGDNSHLETESKGEGPKVIVWCSNPLNVDLFLDDRFGVTDACSTEWAWRVICQATEVDHVSNVYRRLMTATEDTNEIYAMRVPEGLSIQTFGQFQDRVREYNLNRAKAVSDTCSMKNTILLMAYSSDRKLSKNGLVINPEPSSTVRAGGYLIFITYTFDDAIRRDFEEFLRDD